MTQTDDKRGEALATLQAAINMTDGHIQEMLVRAYNDLGKLPASHYDSCPVCERPTMLAVSHVAATPLNEGQYCINGIPGCACGTSEGPKCKAQPSSEPPNAAPSVPARPAEHGKAGTDAHAIRADGVAPSSTRRRNYCEACGYTESHDPNCPATASDKLAAKIEGLQDDGGEGCPFDQDELDLLVKSLRSVAVSATVTQIPDEFKQLAAFYDVTDMAALVRIQEERIEDMRKQLPKPRGPESDPQNYRRG